MNEHNQEHLLTVKDIGEQGLLNLVQSFCPTNVVGDDAAVLTAQPGRSLIVTTDVLVDGVHFSNQTTTAEDAGWRAAAANLSDLAAMGAIPLGITVGLGLPGTVAVNWVTGLYRGLTACLSEYDTAIVGGDICRSPVATIAITAFGEAEPHRIIRRSAARPGDTIVVTGPHGASRAGLELLLHPEQGQSLSADDRATLIAAHQRPKPRLDVLKLLWTEGRGLENAEDGETRRPEDKETGGEGWKIRQTDKGTRRQGDKEILSTSQSGSKPQHSAPAPTPPTPIAGMDSSDGLADAIVQICRASAVGASIERSQISMPAALTQWVEPDLALEWALYGGEDFELVLSLPLAWAQRLVDALGEGAAIVGTITATPGVWLVDTTGGKPEIQLTLEQGFQHFDH